VYPEGFKEELDQGMEEGIIDVFEIAFQSLAQSDPGIIPENLQNYGGQFRASSGYFTPRHSIHLASDPNRIFQPIILKLGLGPPTQVIGFTWPTTFFTHH
jgi:hypothetical protein